MKNNTIELFSLGDIYVSDFLKPNHRPMKGKEDLTLVMEEDTRAVRLSKAVNPDLMYGEYWYRSGINATMRNELKSIVDDCLGCITMSSGDIWVDIACNDGTMFKSIPDDFIKIGIDPADESYANESRQTSDLIIQDFFSAEVYKDCKFGNKKAKIVTAIAMFYDIEDPLPFLEGVYEILDDEGLFVLQMSYTPLMIKQLAFDNICHEHVYYYTLTSIKNLLEKANMQVVDCNLNEINGGSFRLHIRKKHAKESNYKTCPHRDVANYRIESLLNQEKLEKLDTPEPYLEFFKNISDLKDQTFDFIKSEKSNGKTIWGYGASTKGNTLLQWFNLDHSLIDGIAERNPVKYGLKTVGTNIPIYSEDDMRNAHPDYLLVLPWHFIKEFSQREKEYLDNGGKFIVPCPKFDIVGGG